MSKSRSRTVFVCQQCSAESPRWGGRCPNCGAWNSLVETIESSVGSASLAGGLRGQPEAITGIAADSFRRVEVPIDEFNRVLGGGIVPGSLVLIGGDPGIGKSTLLLQVSGVLARAIGKVLYVSGEESAHQIKMRADRLGANADNLFILAETNLNAIMQSIQDVTPSLVIIDSIQTVYLDELESAAGSVGQLRECTMALMRLAKSSHIPIFLVGHVTKEGAIAGPRVLEHIVDTVLYLEGERFHTYRLLRGVKNRFGSTNEIGVFEMCNEGMVEVPNPSQVFLSERQGTNPGSTVAVTVEGTRPLLVEVQALTTATNFGLPRRTANGIDYSRLLLLTAVLTKRVGLGLSNQDVYVNIVGGIKIAEPAIDLGVALAIASSFKDVPIAPDLVAIGEIGLSGELRRVAQVEKRLTEAAKLGFKRCLLPGSIDDTRLARSIGIETIGARSVAEALEIAWSNRF
ncbi:MAG: DNA repair protein RadA [Dehalococcoidales bacterium]|nr:DNA repair protein RadA [Dehalococcoidales bacterium]